MKTKLGAIAAGLAFFCALVVGPVTPARAVECTTQGALALALADVMAIKVISAQAAVDTLTALGVAPALGWNVEACLTDEVSLEISTSFALLKRESGEFDRAQGMIRSTPPPSEASPYRP